MWALFAESGSVSMMRVLSLITTLAAIAIALWGLYLGRDLSGLSILTGVFLSAAFGGKVWQKSLEVKS